MNLQIRYYLIAVVAFLTFLAITLFSSYLDAQQLRRFIAQRELPAAGLAVATKLDNTAYHYKEIGDELLKNNVLRNWILSGEKNPERVVEFMRKVRDRYHLIDASLVSDRTEKYYNSDNTVLQLSPTNKKRDGWYYLFRDSVTGNNIDSWFFSDTGVTEIFVNIPILDQNGKFLGVTGAGIDAARFYSILQSFEKARDVTFKLARRDGVVIYSSDPADNTPLMASTLDLLVRTRDNPAGSLLPPSSADYSLHWGIFLTNWNSFLIVEKSAPSVRTAMWRTASKTFLILGGLALILLTLTLSAVRYVFTRFKEPLRQMNQRIIRQKTVLYYLERFLRSTDPQGTREQDVRVLQRWLDGTSPQERESTGVLELFDLLLLELSRHAEGKNISINWRFEQTEQRITPDAVAAVRIVIQDLFERILLVLPSYALIPTIGSITPSGYRIDIAAGVRIPYIEDEWLEAARELLSTHNMILTVNSTEEGMASVMLFIHQA